MPKKVSQKQRQKQTVIVNVGSTKTRTRRKKSTGKRGKSNITIVPPPVHQVYTSPIHNLIPQYFSGGQQLSIPSLAEQQVSSQIKNNAKNEMDMSLIERMQKQINENKNTVDEMNSYMNRSQPSGYSLDDRSEISSIYSNPESDWYSRNSISQEPYYSLSKEMDSQNTPRESNEEFLKQYYGNKIDNSKNNSLDNDLLQRMERQINDESSKSYYGERVPINPREQDDYFNRMNNSVKGGTPLSNVNVIPFDDLSSMYSDNSASNNSMKSIINPTKKYSEIMSWLDRELVK